MSSSSFNNYVAILAGFPIWRRYSWAWLSWELRSRWTSTRLPDTGNNSRLPQGMFFVWKTRDQHLCGSTDFSARVTTLVVLVYEQPSLDTLTSTNYALYILSISLEMPLPIWPASISFCEIKRIGRFYLAHLFLKTSDFPQLSFGTIIRDRNLVDFLRYSFLSPRMALIFIDPLPPCNETILNNNQRANSLWPFYSTIYANEY